MNVYIVVDLECISGITTGSMIRTGHSEWATRGRQMATAEVNAAIEGALAAGAQRIVVQDGHDSGENLLREELHPAADLLSGGMAVARYMPGLDRTFDALFLIGFHAMMGTSRAHFDHSISTACISAIRLNGTPIGEIGLYAAYAGAHNIPVALVTGDRAGVAEAEALLGNVASVAVKEGVGRFSALVPSPTVVRPRIREAAEHGLKTPARPLAPQAITHLAFDFLRSAEADMAEMLPGAVRTGPRTVEYQHTDPLIAFQAMEAIVNLAGIAASRWAQALYTTGNRVV